METRCHQTSSFVMNSSNKYRSRSWHYSRRKFCSSYWKLTLLVTLVKILVTQHDVTICHALFLRPAFDCFLRTCFNICLYFLPYLLRFGGKFKNFVKIGWDVLKILLHMPFLGLFFQASLTFSSLILIQRSQVLLWLLGQRKSAMGQFIPFIPWLSPCSVLLEIFGSANP